MMVDCVVYRCARQEEMYLYVRADTEVEALSEDLLKRVGALTQVMELSLTPESKLARAEASVVVQKLRDDGFYLQMPPSALLNPQLHFGD